MFDYDFNTAEPPTRSLIPDKTRVSIRLELQPGGDGPGGVFKQTKNDLLMLNFEATVIGGEYDRRKFWPRFLMGHAHNGQLTEGQETGVSIARSNIRGIIEAMRRIDPIDDSPEAAEQRKISSFEDLDGAEIDVIVRVNKNKDPQYDDTNEIARVINPLKDKDKATAASPGKSTAAAAAPASTAARKWGNR